MVNVRLGRKGLPSSNTLAYLSRDEVKKVLKIFRVGQNKLECFSSTPF